MAKYHIVCYMRIDPPSKIKPLDLAEAETVKDQAQLMQPENIYRIEKADEEVKKSKTISKSCVLCKCGHPFIMHVYERTFAEVDCQICECRQFERAETANETE